MTVQGVDYSAGWTSQLVAGLVSGGYRFVMRYISTPGNPKNITSAEMVALHAAGLGVGIVFETTAQRALAGAAAGSSDAASAQRQLDALGTGAAAVYFAVDFDASPAQLDSVLAYVKAAAGVLGAARTGVYGGLKVVQAAAAAEACGLFWQTSAWSGKQISPHANLYQHVYDLKIAGVGVDVNDLLQPPAGIAWPDHASGVAVA